MKINDPSASREHARVQPSRKPGLALVVDLGSHNGTWVNGVRVDRALVGVGDVNRDGVACVPDALHRRQVLGPAFHLQRHQLSGHPGIVELAPGPAPVGQRPFHHLNGPGARTRPIVAGRRNALGVPDRTGGRVSGNVSGN